MCVYLTEKVANIFGSGQHIIIFLWRGTQPGAGNNFGHDCPLRDKLWACYATLTSGIIHSHKFETPWLEKDWNESPRAWAETTDLFPSQILKLASPLTKRMSSVMKLKLSSWSRRGEGLSSQRRMVVVWYINLPRSQCLIFISDSKSRISRFSRKNSQRKFHSCYGVKTRIDVVSPPPADAHIATGSQLPDLTVQVLVECK
jgi:hypothetical protein